MPTKLRILIAEDSPEDAELILQALRQGGFEPQWKRVETVADFCAGLEELPDLIICDYAMPQFDGLRAMDLLRQRGLDIPFILVSGTMGEEQAVEAMKQGITDYLLKDRIGRLGNAVERALEQKQVRDEHRRMQQQLTLHAAALKHAANAILVTDRKGAILWVNPAFTTVTGYTAEEVLGKTPRVLKSGKHDQEFYRDLWKTILSGQTWRGEFINRRKDGSLFYDEHTITPVRPDGEDITRFVGVMHDVTERKRAEAALRDLSGHLLRLQDEERRRIARELHDTTAQKVAALSMNLDSLNRLMPPENRKAGKLLADCAAIAGLIGQEIRTMSYLLHPPVLELVGLAGATRDYALGFAQRSGIQVTVDAPKDFDRLPPDAELALFRVVQESLGNVSRHANSPTATIRLSHTGNFAKVEVQDTGRGIPADKLAMIKENRSALGVGIAGMKERLRQLGGELEIRSGTEGTTVRATLPLAVKQS